MLIDTHCHLDFDELALERDLILSHAQQSDVMACITISTRIKQFEKIKLIADDHKNVFCSIGTHPHNAAEQGEFGITAEQIATLASSHSKVVGIGEAGLDYYYDHAPREAQLQGFRAHIEAARLTNLPVIIHARAADDDMIALLEDEMRKAQFMGVLHCFSSGKKLANKGIELGLYLSFSGILTFKNAQEIQEVAASAPANKILVETDAPYLAPVPHRGQRNEPAFVKHTAQKLADLRGISYEECARLTTENALTLFSKLPRDLR